MRIRAGISNIRNHILVSFVAKGLLPYHRLGSGIKRALYAWPDIDFTDDREGSLFTVTVHRKKEKSSVKTEVLILRLLTDNQKMTVPELAQTFGITTLAVEK